MHDAWSGRPTALRDRVRWLPMAGRFLDGSRAAGDVPHSAMVFWGCVVGVLVVLLAISWRMDRVARRRGATVSGDISYQAREGRRDAEILGNPMNQDVSWSSWSRRSNRR